MLVGVVRTEVQPRVKSLLETSRHTLAQRPRPAHSRPTICGLMDELFKGAVEKCKKRLGQKWSFMKPLPCAGCITGNVLPTPDTRSWMKSTLKQYLPQDTT